MKRPPRAWFKRCVTKVEKSGYADNPAAVCGDLWHHKMSASQKREAVRKERKRKRK